MVDETKKDKSKVNQTAVDKVPVDKTGPNHSYSAEKIPYKFLTPVKMSN